jgi:hypothetical protein
VQGEAERHSTSTPPRRASHPSVGLPAPAPSLEHGWATRGCIGGPSIRRSQPAGVRPLPRLLLRGPAYQPALPPPPPANAIAIRITSASISIHLLRSGSGFSHRHVGLRVPCRQTCLPASLAATATSEGDRDQDQGEFQHDSPHRLEVRCLLRLARFHERADGNWLKQSSCHVQRPSIEC